MKRNLTGFLLLLTMSFSFISCGEDYLDELPTDAVNADDAVSTTSNLLTIVNGMHRMLYSRDGGQGYGGLGTWHVYNEALADDMVLNGNSGYWFGAARWIDHRTDISGYVAHHWRFFYKLINHANRIIEGAEVAEGIEDERNLVLGQAYAYRALAHFNLVQMFGKRYNAGGLNSQPGIPLMLEVTQEGKARSSVEDVYAQINADLDQAISLLTEKRTNKSHFNKAVVQGLKARVALVQGNYTVAADMAAKARAGFPLMDQETYASGFNDYNVGEWMWGAHLNAEQQDTYLNWMAWMSRNFSSTNIRTSPKSINSKLYDLIPETDIRKTLFSPDGEHPDVTLLSTHQKFPYTSQKFLAYNTGDSRGDVVFMRAAEMYLIEAEAKGRLDDFAGAQEVLTELALARDDNYVPSGNTGQALIDEILLQRRWELWGEGFRFVDLKRLNADLDRNGTNHNESTILTMFVEAGGDEWQFIIPIDELNANELMEQNP
ncbi:RagB/SusD family nutrient uptake outer membrane protein [Cytophagales bacterium RKSG123]|nr:RagB/SusD family nutrient uptake outer membrane protein [Xanthovirga aplysinae]